MTHKLSWILSLVAVAVAAVGITRLMGTSSDRPGPADDERLMAERVERLEAGLPRLERLLAQAGARLGAAALVGAAVNPPAPVDDHVSGSGPAEPAVQRAARELRHYEQMDALARAGGGSAVAAKLRQNIEEPGPLGRKMKGKLDIAALECSDALCRVEVRLRAPVAASTMAAAHTLLPGMGNLSMRPRVAGKPAIYYVAAPGQRLPRLDP